MGLAAEQAPLPLPAKKGKKEKEKLFASARICAELKRRGIACTSVRGGQRMFSMAGQPTELAPSEVANLLRLRAR